MDSCLEMNDQSPNIQCNVCDSGGDIKINNFIGDHECSNMPPSFFAENGTSMIADDAMVLTLK